MDPFRIAIRSIVVFAYMLAVVRLSGKRAVSEGTAFDFVLGLILGDLVDDAIYSEVPIANFAVAAGTLVFLELIVSTLVHRFDQAMWWFEGRPGSLLKMGSLTPDVMKQEKVNEQEVIALTRLQGLEKEKWHQIKLMTIEADGEEAVLRKYAMQDAQKKEKKLLLKKSNA
jgi:uncharacterized membrane protein YcaP (DUF421 family)